MAEALDPETILAEGMEALREMEVEWLADSLGIAISSLGYPVGCGQAPHPDALRLAGTKVFERYAKIVELASRRNLERDAQLIDALESIANNTCCEGCGEAAKVARAAISSVRASTADLQRGRGGNVGR